MLAEKVVSASAARVATTEAFVTATEAFATAAEAFLWMAAAKGMEASTRLGRLEGRPGEAIPPKSSWGGTLRKIVTLKTRSCRGTIGWLRTAIRGTRLVAGEAGAIRGTAILLRRIHRRLHVVVSLLYRPGVADSAGLVTAVEAFGRPAPCISLGRAGKSLAISRAVATILTIATRSIASCPITAGHCPALGEVTVPAVCKAPVAHRS